MLHGVMSAGLEDVIEAHHVAHDVGIGIGDAIAHTSLGSEVHDNLGLILLKNTIDGVF